MMLVTFFDASYIFHDWNHKLAPNAALWFRLTGAVLWRRCQPQ